MLNIADNQIRKIVGIFYFLRLLFCVVIRCNASFILYKFNVSAKKIFMIAE